MKKEKLATTLIIVITLFSAIELLFLPPIAQDINYHSFSDSRSLFSILNFWNVVSNLPFLFIGILGLYKTVVTDTLNIIEDIKIAYILLFLGITLTAFGSGYYHLYPINQTLVWDRLALTIIIMSLFSIVISEFISACTGKALLFPFIFAGISSVAYWYFSELQGAGDLRYYAFVQFFPLFVIPIILVCFRSRYNCVKAYWLLLLLYVVAKVFEQFDDEVFSGLGFISGHSIKHFIAALGLYILLVSYQRRRCSKDKSIS